MICQYVDEIDLATLIFSTIIDCIDVYFGIRQGQLSDAFIKKAVTKIAYEFPNITISDIEYSFDRYSVPQKDNWKNITIDEIILPIKTFSNIKHKIESERIKIEQEINERNKVLLIEQEFISKAKETYLKSLEKGKWIGDMYQAKVIYNHFRNNFTQEQRENLKKESRIEEIRIIESGQIDSYLYTFERILAQKVVTIAIQEEWHLKN